MSAWARHRGKLVVTVGVLLAPVSAHFAARWASRPEPPPVELPTNTSNGVVTRQGKLRVAHLSGTPREIGATHARLLHAEMVETERVVWELFEMHVPNSLVRMALLDYALFRYRHLESGFAPERRDEIAAGAAAFEQDPFTAILPTYQRFVHLTALYDVSLAFEGSPLIGCTTLLAANTGGAFLARAFDFEAHDVFDDEKVVFLVREQGAIPFASVAWAGLVGVVSGMNAEGLAVVVHGARAGEPRVSGEPVVHALRRVLATARTTDDALARLAEQDPMVSHLVVAADAHGSAVAIERVPGEPPFARVLALPAAVTNHLEGPFADDPKNQRVIDSTSTFDRRRRADEIVREIRDVESAIAALRDRRGPGGTELPEGDRRSIDAGIATHGVVADTRTRTLWVSEGPHLDGRFVAFDVGALASPEFDPRAQPPVVAVAGRTGE